MNETNGLALLAHKCAPNVFDLSTDVVYASIRDQIVRAQLLIRDLRERDENCKSILIVGGGVSGVSAAAMASELEIKFLLVDAQDGPFSLQSNVKTRFVGPFMYEWPEIGYDSQNYPPKQALAKPPTATPCWEAKRPISAAELADQLKKWLSKQNFRNQTGGFFFGVNPNEVSSYVKKFVAHFGPLQRRASPPQYQLPEGNYKNHAGKSVTVTRKIVFCPDYIVLAAGMGNERVALPANKEVQGSPFWANDDLTGVEESDSCVFGGGDGALQDVFRLLTVHEHPLNFIDALMKGRSAKEALCKKMPLLAALDKQSRLLATWSDASCYQHIDNQCRDITKELANFPRLRKIVFAQLRPGNSGVHHVFREQFFGKAYLLNRFVVHLIEQCLLRESCTGKVTYVAHRRTDVTRAKKDKNTGTYLIRLEGDSYEYRFHWIAVRYGADPDSAPQKQMVTLSKEDLADRISMAAIPLPTTVPEQQRKKRRVPYTSPASLSFVSR